MTTPAMSGRAYFSEIGPPRLPSMVYDEVFMSQFAFLDANVEIAGSLTVDGALTATGFAGPALTPTAVQVSTYGAAAQDLVLASAASGSITVTLPAAPADKALVGVLAVGMTAGNTVTVLATGGFTVNTGPGAALTLSLLAQSVLLQYSLSLGTWLTSSGNPVLGQAVGLAPSGDSSGVTDSAAVQGLINAGGYVKLGLGNFDFSATLNPTSTNTVIEGSGWGTVLRWDTSAVSPAIGMADTTQRTVTIRNCRIANKGASSAGTAILADYFTSQSVIEKVKIDSTGGHNPNVGIAFGVVSQNTHYCAVRDCRIAVDGTNAAGVKFLGGSTGAISNVLDNCRILISTTDATQTGVIVATRSIEIGHVDIESGAGIGVDIQTGGDCCTLISPYLESNGTNVQFASGVVSPTIIGGTILTGTTADITDNGAIAPIIIGVRTTGGVAYDRFVVQQNATAGKIVYVKNTAATPSDAALRIDATSGQQAVGVRASGDGANRLRIISTGGVQWGNGTSAADVQITRAGAGALQVSTDTSAQTPKSLDPYLGGEGFLAPTGAFGQTMPRRFATVSNIQLAVSGTVYLTAIYLPAGVTVGHITFVTGTANVKTGGTDGWYVLCDSGLVVRDATADQTDAGTVWGTTSTAYTLATTAGYVTTYAGLYYVGIMVANSGGTQPNIVSGAAAAGGIAGITPKLAGASSSGQTTAPATDGSATLTSITSDAARQFYAYVTG